MGYAHGMLGHEEEAMECIRKMEQRGIEDPEAVVESDIMGVWFALGNYDKVFYHIERVIEKRTAPIGFFLEYPPFKKLKVDPRYNEMRKKAGLEPVVSPIV